MLIDKLPDKSEISFPYFYKKNKLDSEYYSRYARQIILPQLGLNGQKKLSESNVLIIGCGGLGGPVLTYLAAAGVGLLGLIEFDTVSLSNLHRQTIFDTKDIGQPKIEIAKQRILSINPNVKVLSYNTRLTNQNALEICKDFDLIVDGSDNFPTRYLVNDTCEILSKPYIYGAIHQMEGQVAVFNLKGSATYRDLYNVPPNPDTAPNCAIGGVLGPVAGIIGSLQALEAIKVICDIEKPLVNEILVLEFQSMIFRKLKLTKILDRPKIHTLINYEAFCSGKQHDPLAISKEEFINIDAKNLILIDIREKYEHEEFNIGGENIPQDEIDEGSIQEGKKYLLYCASGIRSKALTKKLKQNNQNLDIQYLNCSLKEFI